MKTSTKTFLSLILSLILVIASFAAKSPELCAFFTLISLLFISLKALESANNLNKLNQ